MSHSPLAGLTPAPLTTSPLRPGNRWSPWLSSPACFALYWFSICSSLFNPAARKQEHWEVFKSSLAAFKQWLPISSAPSLSVGTEYKKGLCLTLFSCGPLSAEARTYQAIFLMPSVVGFLCLVKAIRQSLESVKHPLHGEINLKLPVAPLFHSFATEPSQAQHILSGSVNQVLVFSAPGGWKTG